MDNNQDKINYESELILCDGPNCSYQMKIIPIITFDNIHKKNGFPLNSLLQKYYYYYQSKN